MAIYPSKILGQGGSGSMSGDQIVSVLTNLPQEKKLSVTAIQNAVTSVNNQTGAVNVTAQGINAQVSSPMLTAISNTTWGNDVLMGTDDSGNMSPINYTSYSRQLLSMSSKQQLIDSLGLQPGQYPVTSVNGMMGVVELTANEVGAADVNHTHEISQVIGLQDELDSKITQGEAIPYSSLTGTPNIPNAQVNSDWNSDSGVSRILNKPVLFDGNYNSLTNKPTIPVVNYPVTSVNTKTGEVVLSPSDIGAATVIHTHVISDVTGLSDALADKVGVSDSIPYTRITGTPALSTVAITGSYTDLVNKPVIPPAQIQSDWNQTNSSSLDYIKNKPAIPVVNYPVVSVNSKTGTVVLTNTDVGAAATQHSHVIGDVSGLQTALDSKITTGATIPYSTLSGTPVIPTNNSFSFVGLNDTDNTIVNSGYLKWNSTGTSIQYDSTIPYTSLSGTPTIPTNNNQLTNGSGFVTASQAANAAPVQSVNGKTGVVILSASDVGAASSGSIPTNNSFTLKGLSDTDDVAVANGFLRWNSAGTSVSYIAAIPYTALSGTPVLATVATSGSYADLTNRPTLFSGSYTDLTNKPTLFDGTWTSLTGKPTTLAGYGITDAVTATTLSSTLSGYVTTTALTSGLSTKLNTPTGTTSQYLRGDGTLATFPTIPIVPTVVSAFTNDLGYVTASTAPVTSVNTKTGAVVLTASDIGAATSAQGTKYYRSTNVQASGVKVKYYSVTSDANGAWSLSLGTDFTELLDVQATAVSSSGITGVRQASLNSFTSTSTTLTGNTWGNTVLVTILVSGTNSLSLTPNTVVRVRAEGIGV